MDDMFCIVFSYARYSKYKQEIIGFRMKVSLSLPRLGWKFSNSLREEDNWPIYTYNDK